MKKQRTKKERSKKYDKKVVLKDNVTFDALIDVALKHDPNKDSKKEE